MNIIVLELILVAFVALGLGLWQLWDVNRALRKHRDDDAPVDTDRGHDQTDGDEHGRCDERQHRR